jgi:hypothetical protein
MLHEMSIAQCGDKPMVIANIWLMPMLMLICCERNTICSLKSTAEVVLKNMAKVFVMITVVADRSLLLYA